MRGAAAFENAQGTDSASLDMKGLAKPSGGAFRL
jgi:hypothetical protein